MKAERIILSFVAILVGLFAAGVAFYLYQSTRALPPEKTQTIAIAKPTNAITPPPAETGLLTIDTPKEDEVFNKKQIRVSGKAEADATIIVSTEDADQIAEPAANGTFTVTVSIPDGTSILRVTSILPSGEETVVNRAVTFTTENF